MSPVSFDITAPYSPVLDTVSPPPPRLAEQRQVLQAVKALNKSEYFGENNELTFQMDRESGRPVIRILDRSTQELVSQIPPEYVLEVAESLQQYGA